MCRSSCILHPYSSLTYTVPSPTWPLHRRSGDPKFSDARVHEARVERSGAKLARDSNGCEIFTAHAAVGPGEVGWMLFAEVRSKRLACSRNTSMAFLVLPEISKPRLPSRFEADQSVYDGP